MKARDFDFVDVDYAEAKNLGVNLVALGNGKVLSMKGATNSTTACATWALKCSSPTCRCSPWAVAGCTACHRLCAAIPF